MTASAQPHTHTHTLVPHNAAQHVAAANVAGHHSVSDQGGGGARVIGHYAQGA